MALNILGANTRGGDMTESQDDKYLKHNDHVDLVAEASNAVLAIALGNLAGDAYALSAEDFTENAVFVLSAAGGSPTLDAAFTFQLPATQRRLAVVNLTDFTATVQVGAGPAGLTVAVAPDTSADLSSNGTDVRWITNRLFVVGFSFGQFVYDAIAGSHVAVAPFRLPKDLPDSQAYAWTPSGAGESDRVISIQKNESQIGTVTFAAEANTGTFVLNADQDFAVGNRLRLVNPSDPSPSEPSPALQDVSIDLKGVLL
ncbi:MAG TPA: hypothetical protein VGA50_04660 [Kiloniellales bacterium]